MRELATFVLAALVFIGAPLHSAQAANDADGTVNVYGPDKSYSIRVGRKKFTSFFMDAQSPVRVDVPRSGKLVLNFYQLQKKKNAPKGSIEFSLDGTPPLGVRLNGKSSRKIKMIGKPGRLAKPIKRVDMVGDGSHIVNLTAVGSTQVAVVVAFYIATRMKPLPVVLQKGPPPEKAEEPAAVAMDNPAPPPVLDPSGPNDDAGPVVTDPPLDDDPTIVEEIAAANADATPLDPAASALQARITAGEIRDGLVHKHTSLVVVRNEGDETHTMHLVQPSQPYDIMLAGPGVLSLRIQQLTGAATKLLEAGKKYSIVVLENDVMLRNLDIVGEYADKWSVEGDSSAAVAQPRQYRFEIGGKEARLAMHVPEDLPTGVLMEYSFEAGERTSGMDVLALGLEGMGGMSLIPDTTVTEIDMRETVVEKVVYLGGEQQEYFGLGARAGVVVPIWGGEPAMGGGVELRFIIPFLERMFAIGVEIEVQHQTLVVSAADPRGAELNASATALGVPLFGAIHWRMRARRDVSGLCCARGRRDLGARQLRVAGGQARRERGGSRRAAARRHRSELGAGLARGWMPDTRCTRPPTLLECCKTMTPAVSPSGSSIVWDSNNALLCVAPRRRFRVLTPNRGRSRSVARGQLVSTRGLDLCGSRRRGSRVVL